MGFAIAQKLLAEGYWVATFSRKSSPQLQSLQQEYPDNLYWQAVDVSDAKLLAAFLKNVRQTFGRVGYLINSAGMANEGLLTTQKGTDISRMLNVNLEGTIRLSQLVAKQMMVANFGVIVNISSIVGIRGYKGVAAYSATKAAMDGFTRSLSRELGSMGVRVNSVAPGFMETDMTDQLTEKQKARIIRQTPLGRLGTVADVADVVSYLLSDKAAFLTGQTLVVDGGLTV